MLRVRLLGEFGLELDGRELALPRSRRARALLAWLALRPGAHARAELAARFWPEVLDESARTSLRAALAELRRALGAGGEHLVATREAVGLADVEAVWVDTREVERLLAAGELERAVEAGAGELLAGQEGDWVQEARAAHATRIGEALERLAAEEEALGRHAQAARHTRAALVLDPLAEETARALMRRLAAAGDRAAAIAVYDQLGERMRDALAIPPSAATRALAAEIRRAAAPAVEVPPPAALDRAGELPFVGRERELARLRSTWAAVARQRARRLVLVAGEPGVGKTHLMLRFAREVAGEATVLLGRCSEEPLGPYEPFAEMLRACEAALGPDGLAALAGAGARELERLLGEAQPEPEGDAGARHRLFEGVDAALAGVTAGRPLLLLVDDIQWADRPTLLLLGALLRSPRRSPALVVATSRDGLRGGALGRALADLQRDRSVDRLSLGGLARDDVASLAASRLGEDAAARMMDALHARTGGNAYFVEELLLWAAEHGGEGVPDSVRQAIAARLARLSEDALHVVALASVLGLEVDVALLEAVAGIDAEAALDELAAAHLLQPAAGGAPRVEFPHALVREAVDGELNAARRQRLHRRAAEALAAISEERHLEAIAHHLAESGAGADVDRVVDYLTRAGARAMAMLAYEEGARLYGRALAALAAHGLSDGARAGRLSAARGDALLRAGDREESERAFAAAAALARRNGDAEGLAGAALGRAGVGVAIIDVDAEEVALLEEALAAVGDSDPILSSQLLARLAVELYYAPTRDRSEALSAEAVAVARSAGDTRAVAAALNARHVALWRPDRLRERLETAEAMIEAARAAGDRGLELQARNWRAVDLFERGDLAAWRAEARRHGALAEELRLPAFTWYTPLWAAGDALHAGRFEEAAALRAQALEAGERAGDRNATLFVQLLRFEEAFIREDLALFDEAFVLDRMANSPAAVAWRAGYAWFMTLTGRADEARRQLAILSADRYAALPFDANWPSAIAECAETCLRLGDGRYAEPLYDRLAPYAGRPITAGRAVSTYGAADRQLGGLAEVLGRVDAAIAHYESAIRLDAAAGLRPWVARGRRGLARALRQRGDHGAARVVEQRAADEERALGLT